MQKKLLPVLACLMAGTALSARAQIANDECAGAIPLPLAASGSTSLVTTNAGATNGALAPQACGSTAAHNDVWYALQVPASGAVSVTTGGVTGSPFTDTVLELYAGSCAALTPLASNDDYTSAHHYSSLTVTGQPAGSTLYVRVYGFGTATGAFTVQASEALVLTNDEITGATPVPVDAACTVVTSTNAGASASTAAPAPCFQGTARIANDVWFSVEVPASGQLAVTTKAAPGSDLTDTGLVLYTGTPGQLTPVACNDDLGGSNFFSGALAAGLPPGSTVYVRVWSAGCTLPGAFGICVVNPTLMATTPRAAKLSLQVSPNPVRENLNIKLPTLADQRSAQVSLRNSAGQVVKLRLVSLRPRDGETSLNVADLPAGVYTLRLQTGTSTGSQKVVIE